MVVLVLGETRSAPRVRARARDEEEPVGDQWAPEDIARLTQSPTGADAAAPSAPVGVEGLMQLARNWCLTWGEWAHDADPGGAKENAAETALRAALTTALAQQPAACPKCDGTGEADSGGIHPWGAPATIPCDCQQPAAVDGEMLERACGAFGEEHGGFRVSRVKMRAALAAQPRTDAAQQATAEAQAIDPGAEDPDARAECDLAETLSDEALIRELGARGLA